MQTRPVVFVSFRNQRPAVGLARAVDLAVRFGASLHVVLVTWDHALSPDPRLDDEAWLETSLPADLPRVYHSTVGHLVHEAIEYARAHDAQMVVLPADVGQSGACVSAIAAAARVCVFVAREPTASDAIVAATDLRDPRLPVIAQAARMVGHVETSLVGVHSVPPASTDEDVTRQRTRLASALSSVTLEPVVVVEREPDPVDTILTVARERDADLVVTGVRPSTWLDSVLEPSVASRVIAATCRSVLLVPVEAR